MSKFSGKCDCYDWFCDYDDERLKMSEIYLPGQIIPLKIESQKDLAPYYAYLIAVGSQTKEGGSVVHLSNESFIDTEERERLSWILRDFQAYWRSCKRKKIPFIVDEAIENVLQHSSEELERKIAEIVRICGDKATAQELVSRYGIHAYIHDYYRELLLKEMVKLGWPENKAKYWLWKDHKYLVEKFNY